MLAGRRCRLAVTALLLLPALLGDASSGSSGAVEPETQLSASGCRGARLPPGGVPAAGTTWPPRADAVVAKEGGCGNDFACFTTIQQALKAAPDLVPCEKQRYVVLVKSGVYEEPFIKITRKNVMLLGEGADRTVITGSKSNGTQTPMDQTATVSKLSSSIFRCPSVTLLRTFLRGSYLLALLTYVGRGMIYSIDPRVKSF